MATSISFISVPVAFSSTEVRSVSNYSAPESSRRISDSLQTVKNVFFGSSSIRDIRSGAHFSSSKPSKFTANTHVFIFATEINAKLKVLVAGGTGFVGKRVVKRLVNRGDDVVLLTRNASRAAGRVPRGVTVVEYDPSQPGPWQNVVDGCDAVINLAGASISDGRWTASRKREILESRALTTKNLVDAIGKASVKPGVLINASAIGFYGVSETDTFKETSAAGKDFLASVCTHWEGAAQRVKEVSPATRLAILRLGIVLGEEGGALSRMIPIFNLFAGGPLGSGRQWFSWIHVDDLVLLIERALTDPSISGVYNATAPNPVRMNALCDSLGRALSRPNWLPVPSFALEALLGEGAQIVLNGQQVLPERTLSAGFKFRYPTIDQALSQIVTN